MKRNWFKGFLSGVIVSLLILASVGVYAGGYNRTIDVVLNGINIQFNGILTASIGENYEVNNGDQVPFSILYKGTTYLPIRKFGELFEKDITWDSATQTAGIQEKSEEIDETYADGESPEGPVDSDGVLIISDKMRSEMDLFAANPSLQAGKSYVQISSVENPVYWVIDKNTGNEHWFYTINFEEINGVGLHVEEIRETYYDPYSGGHNLKYDEQRIRSWPGWEDGYIGPLESKILRGGGDKCATAYMVWSIKGTDDNGNEVEYKTIVGMSQNGLDDDVEVVALKPTHDTTNLRYNAAFEVEVDDGVKWVPANVLGDTTYSNEEIEGMIHLTPNEKKNKIDTLYEAIQLYQISGFIDLADTNTRHVENGIDWEYHIPGEEAVRINGGNCSTNSSWLGYILEGDYEEVGYIAYSQEDGSGHVFNYIKDNGFYYVIDLTHYRMDFIDASSIESGSLTDYRNSDFIAGNLHKVSDLSDYVDYCRLEYNDPPELFFFYQADYVSDIGVRSDGDNITILYPNIWNVINIYDNPNDSLKYAYISPPSYQPDWTSFRAYKIESQLPFE